MAGQRVMLVHENADCRRIYATALTHEGYDVTVVANGDEALELYSASAWALVVTDLFVQSEVDDCFLRLLRQSTASRARPPVLVLSAWSTDDHRHLANAAGADAFFPLPVAPTDFLIVVHDLLAPRLPPTVTLRATDGASASSTWPHSSQSPNARTP
jgi:DNA-binding response OmpR family regulator